MNIPDVPCLIDSSAVIIGDLDKLDSAIVIYLSYPIWSQVWVMTVLALLAGADCHDVSDMVLMWDACGVFSLLVLSDELLLSLFNALPIGFK